MLQVLHGRVHAAAIARQLPRRHGKQPLGRQRLGIARGQKTVKIHRALRAELRGQLVERAAEAALVAGQNTRGQIPFDRLPQCVLPGVRSAREIAVVAEEHRRIAREIACRRGKFGIQKRHVAVGTGKAHAVFQPVKIPLQRAQQRRIRRFSALLPRNERADILAQARNARRMQCRDTLGHGQQYRRVRIFRASLRNGVEKAHRVQLVAEKFRAQRLILCRREHVHNAAAQRVLPHAFDERRARIARRVEPCRELLRLAAHPRSQTDGRAAENIARHRAQAQRVETRNENLHAAHRQLVQKPQPLLLPLARNARRVDKRQLAPGQHRRAAAQKRGQLILHPRCGQLILTDDKCRTARLGAERRDEMAAHDLAHARHGGGLARVDGFFQLRKLRHRAQQLQQYVHGGTSFKKMEISENQSSQQRGQRSFLWPYCDKYSLVQQKSTYPILPLNLAAAAGTPSSITVSAASAAYRIAA